MGKKHGTKEKKGWKKGMRKKRKTLTAHTTTSLPNDTKIIVKRINLNAKRHDARHAVVRLIHFVLIAENRSHCFHVAVSVAIFCIWKYSVYTLKSPKICLQVRRSLVPPETKCIDRITTRLILCNLLFRVDRLGTGCTSRLHSSRRKPQSWRRRASLPASRSRCP